MFTVAVSPAGPGYIGLNQDENAMTRKVRYKTVSMSFSQEQFRSDFLASNEQ